MFFELKQLHFTVPTHQTNSIVDHQDFSSSSNSPPQIPMTFLVGFTSDSSFIQEVTICGSILKLPESTLSDDAAVHMMEK
jgi:hypothetical protein